MIIIVINSILILNFTAFKIIIVETFKIIFYTF